MLFGDDKTVSQYASDPRVEVHGSGRSKVLIGEDKIDQWRSLTSRAGRVGVGEQRPIVHQRERHRGAPVRRRNR